MARPLQVGITGGIGSGKSTVAKIFNVLGIPVYDADSRAKALMNTDSILIEQIKRIWRCSLQTVNSTRKYLAQQVLDFRRD